MRLSALRLLLKHLPELQTTYVCHPENSTPHSRQRFWFLSRWAASEEKFAEVVA